VRGISASAARGLGVAMALLAAPGALEAQPAGKVYRIGVLELVDEASNSANMDAFREGLAVLGYTEGRTYVIEYRSANGQTQRSANLARELVQADVDVIVTRGTPAALAAKAATRTIPVVMASSGDPVAEGIVASMARPGGNITGLHTMAAPEVGGKRLRLLKEVAPGSLRVGVVWNPGDHYSPLIVRDIERVARVMKVPLRSLELPRFQPLEQMFETALFDQVDALIAVEDYFTLSHRARIVEFAAMSRIPAIYGLREFVDAGGLMSYGTDRRDLFRRAAAYVDRVLRGARPADLAVEAPVRFELAINLKTAGVLGLTIPAALLRQADYVVR
jgi:putative ABC transport system substrate-binding protein